MLPVTELTQRFPDETVVWLDDPELELSRESLPAETRILVLRSSLIQSQNIFSRRQVHGDDSI